MRKYFLLMIGLVGFFSISKAQTPSDSIFVARGFLGYNFYQTDVRLNFNQLPYVMQNDLEATELITKAKSNYTIATILSGAGGFLIGWQLGTAIVGGDPNWVMAGIGGGLAVASIPLFSKSYRLSLDAVEVYNSKLTVARRLPPMLRAGLTSQGLGLSLRF